MSTPLHHLDLSGRVALVTGCGRPRGIGAAIAHALAEAGAGVAVHDVPDAETSLGQVAAEIAGATGAQVTPHTADLCEATAADTLVAAAVAAHGRLDILVNNAAAPHGSDRGDPADVEIADVDALLTVNLRAAILLSRAAIPVMRVQGGGRIVNISSQAGRIGTSGRAVYSTTKAGMLGMTRALAVDLGGSGITVNAVCPGAIETDRLADTLSREAGADEARQRFLATIPAGRLGRPRDIAAAVLFLASDHAEYVSGHALAVDGARFAI